MTIFHGVDFSSRERGSMGKQRTFASVAWQQKGKTTRRERFLAEMDAVIPWGPLLAVIAPYYPKAGRGRRPHELATMLRIYFVQQWFNLSDPQAEDALYDSESIRRFVGVELLDDAVPDETTILRFRHLLERYQLTTQIFAAMRTLLEEKRLLLKSGTIVDATIIAAPSSTKNAAHARDPEMHQTRKGKDWHFGMKLHVGTDRQGLVHSVTATDAATADITQLPHLVHGAERDLYGDQAYWSETHRQHWTASGGRYRVNRRAPPRGRLTRRQWWINRRRSQLRARGEHPFHVVKHLWASSRCASAGSRRTSPARIPCSAWPIFIGSAGACCHGGSSHVSPNHRGRCPVSSPPAAGPESAPEESTDFSPEYLPFCHLCRASLVGADTRCNVALVLGIRLARVHSPSSAQGIACAQV